MAHYIHILLLIFTACKSSLPPHELNALIDFYHATNGQYWTNCECPLNCPWNITDFAAGNFDCLGTKYCGLKQTESIQCSIIVLAFDKPHNLSGVIPPAIANFTALTQIIFAKNPDIDGAIPYSMFNLTSLQHIEFSATANYLSLPQANWCNFINAQTIFLDHIIFPENSKLSQFNCLLKTKETTNLYALGLRRIKSIDGPIPSTFCNLKSDKSTSLATMLQLMQLDDMSTKTTIPQCIYAIEWLTELDIYNVPAIYGTISPNICNLTHLETLSISGTQISGTIPPCLLNKMSQLKLLELARNNLHGTIKTKPHFPVMMSLYLNDNNFYGSLSSLFMDNHMPYLNQIALQNNNFDDDDIKSLLKYWLTEFTALTLIAISGNNNVHGSLPKNITNILMERLAAHECDLHGTIPNDLLLSNLQFLTLYSNRLSGSISNNLVSPYFDKNELTSVVLTGNLFYVHTMNDIPSWLSKSSPFSTADNLVISDWDTVKSWIIFVMSCLSLLLFMTYKVITFFKKSHAHEKDDEYDFDSVEIKAFKNNIDVFMDHFINGPLFVGSLLLVIFYALTSNYYEVSPFLFHFTISFYYTWKDWVNWILLVLCVIYNMIICYNIYKLIIHREEIRLQKQDQYENDTVLFVEQPPEKEEDSTIRRLFIFIAYLLVFSCGLLSTIFYLVFESLPNDNILNMNEVERQLITNSVGVILALNTSIIVPNLVDSVYNLIYKNYETQHIEYENNRMMTIVILRSLILVVLPMICGIIILNDCGRSWTQWWNPCIDDKGDFNIDIMSDDGTNVLQTLLTSNDICSIQSINEINWNKCLRSFFYQWTYIVMVKLCVMIIMPIFVICYKILRSKLWEINGKWEINQTTVDSAYVTLVNKIEIILIFSFISPLIIPITFVSLKSNSYWNQIMIYKLKWKLKWHQNNLQLSFPSYFLFYSIIFAQFLSGLFVWFCVNKGEIFIILVTLLIITDIACIICLIGKMRLLKKVIPTIQSHTDCETSLIQNQ